MLCNLYRMVQAGQTLLCAQVAELERQVASLQASSHRAHPGSVEGMSPASQPSSLTSHPLACPASSEVLSSPFMHELARCSGDCTAPSTDRPQVEYMSWSHSKIRVRCSCLSACCCQSAPSVSPLLKCSPTSSACGRSSVLQASIRGFA